MNFVALDASVAAKWYLNEDARDLALRLLDDEGVQFVAPDIFYPEVVDTLLKRNRDGTFSDDLLDRALLDLWATLPLLVPSSSLVNRAIGVARALTHPIYDCLYLVVAERWDTVFVTADIKFAQLCRAGRLDESLASRIRTMQEFYAS